VLIAKLGQDGHDRGQKVIATGFADLGFTVDVGPLFATPAEAAAEAARTTSTCWGLFARRRPPDPGPRTEGRTSALDRQDIMLVVGGVIPDEDLAALEAEGVAAVFQPGTVLAEAAMRLLDELNRRLGYAQGRRLLEILAVCIYYLFEHTGRTNADAIP